MIAQELLQIDRQGIEAVDPLILLPLPLSPQLPQAVGKDACKQVPRREAVGASDADVGDVARLEHALHGREFPRCFDAVYHDRGRGRVSVLGGDEHGLEEERSSGI